MAGCQRATGKVVVIGGGFAGAAAAKALKEFDRRLDVVLIDPQLNYVLAPGSNLALAGERTVESLTVNLDRLRDVGIAVMHEVVMEVDSDRCLLRTSRNTVVTFDYLIVASGASANFEAVSGYVRASISEIPHAWWPGDETRHLKRLIELVPAGGTVLICPATGPVRGPAAPYERASLIAHRLAQINPRAKVLILDPRETFPMQSLFQDLWRERYGGMVEWTGGVNHKIARVDPLTRAVVTDFGDTFHADVINLIPPQRAAEVTASTGLRDRAGWCPVDHASFESLLRPGIHVIGDGADLDPLPKTATAAIAEARIAAAAVVAKLSGREPDRNPQIQCAIQALGAPDVGFSIRQTFAIKNGKWSVADTELSPRQADAALRKREADDHLEWIAKTAQSLWGPEDGGSATAT